MRGTKPVFNDETGRRAAVMLWVAKVVVAICLILCVAIGLTLTTHIALPGLDGLVSPTLNESRPKVALATDPGTIDGSDVANLPTEVSPTTTFQETMSASSSSRPTAGRSKATDSATATGSAG